MLSRRLPPLKALRVFEAAARHANFTAAADELNITHSAVSQQIRLIEDYLGQPLFAREARGVSLLPHAREYFEAIKLSLDQIASATQRFTAPAQRRKLRICMTPSLAMKWLIPRLADFQAQVPDAELQLSTVARQFFEQAESQNDVLIQRRHVQRPGYTCVRCLDDYLVPVASPRLIARHRFNSPVDCLGHPLLQAAGEIGNWSRWFGLAGVAVPQQLPGPTFDHQFLCLQAAVNELGLALAPWCLLEEDLSAGRLRPLFTEPQLLGPGIYAMYRADSPSADLASQFIAWIGQQGRRNPGPSPTGS